MPEQSTDNHIERKANKGKWQANLVIGVLGIIAVFTLYSKSESDRLQEAYIERARDIKAGLTAMPEDEMQERLALLPDNLKSAFQGCLINPESNAPFLFGTCTYLHKAGVISIPYHPQQPDATLDIASIHLQSPDFDVQVAVSDCRPLDELLERNDQTQMALCRVDPDQLPAQMVPLDEQYYPDAGSNFIKNDTYVSLSFPALNLNEVITTYDDHPASVDFAIPHQLHDNEQTFILTVGGGSSNGVIFSQQQQKVVAQIYQTDLGQPSKKHPTLTYTSNFPTYLEMKKAINKLLNDAASG